MDISPRHFLQSLFYAAVAAAQSSKVMPAHMHKLDAEKKLHVIGAGKASAAMARAVERNWKGEIEGVVITRYGYGVPCDHIEIVEAAHPVPDQAGMDATRRLLEYVSSLGENDQLLCLISGGGSALLSLPLEGITLEEKQQINAALLASGATISEINCIRRHISQVKGGRLAATCFPAKLTSFMISDVPGDNLMDIASGPTVGDPTTRGDALKIIERYGLEFPQNVLACLSQEVSESIKPEDERLKKVRNFLIATPQVSLDAAAKSAGEAGVQAHILGDRMEGEAREMAKKHAQIVKEFRAKSSTTKPCVLLSGGEATVTLNSKGCGGPNVEFLLALAIELQGLPGVYALAADTDGVDGGKESAGAFCAPDTLERSMLKNISADKMLQNNDAHRFFEQLGDDVITGPTLTNVNDFRAILIL